MQPLPNSEPEPWRIEFAKFTIPPTHPHHTWAMAGWPVRAASSAAACSVMRSVAVSPSAP